MNALRFFLALVVLIFHVPSISRTIGFNYFDDSPIFHKGELSVYYFFTLSGFLIIRLIYLEIEKTGNFNLLIFYKRRAGRIVPLYLLVLFIGIFLYQFLLPFLGIPFDVEYSLFEVLFYNIFFLSNVFKILYPELGGILSVLWSIGVEEQFYLICPPLLFFLKKRMSFIICLSLLTLFFILIPQFYKYNSYFFYFTFGGLISILSESGILKWLNIKILKLLFLLLFLISFFTNLFNVHSNILFHLINMIISGLFIFSISNNPLFQVKNQWVNYMGKISYGIYLYHMVVLTGILFVLKKVSNHTLFSNSTLQIIGINLSTIFITIIISSVSNKYFENLFYKSRIEIISK